MMRPKFFRARMIHVRRTSIMSLLSIIFFSLFSSFSTEISVCIIYFFFLKPLLLRVFTFQGVLYGSLALEHEL